MIRSRLYKSLGIIREPEWKAVTDLQLATSVDDKPDTVSSSNSQWLATGHDPQFVCRTRGWIPGWYMLELSIEHDQPTGFSSLFLDTGQGFFEVECIKLPLRQVKVSKRLVYLPARLRRLRFDPMEAIGKFKVHYCRFVWLSPSFAQSRLQRRLSQSHPDYRDLKGKELVSRLKGDAELKRISWRQWALRAYEQTFSYVSFDYVHWLKDQAGNSNDADRLLREVDHWNIKPTISILIPVFNTDPLLLKECIESVTSQSYVNWQLCIADDASTSASTREVLESFANSDSRINIVWREENGHISAASNSALSIATGDFTALLDHDDRLDEHALLYVVSAINENPDAQLIYSDEDKINTSGERFAPHFKPDWNPDLLLSQNYISHLGVYRTDRLRHIGGFREGFEGSQDHDLSLRFTAGIEPRQITHIQKVLYHWRAVEGSTALDSDEKQYTGSAGRKAVERYVQEVSPDCEVTHGLVSNSYRVRWPLPSELPLVSLLIPTRDGVEILRPCVDAILTSTDYTNFEVLILDNQSSCTETLRYMDEVVGRDQRVRVLRWNYPFNYSAINNFGARYAKGSILGLVNNDIEPINSEWLTEMVSQVCRREIGCVGAKLYYPDNTLQHGGVILGIGGVAGHSHKFFPSDHSGYFSRLKLVQNLSAVTAACLLVRKEVFDEVGGLNEEHLKVAFNDVDLCLKVREAGYRNLWTPYAELYHHESVSRGGEDNPEKQARFQREIDYMRRTWGPLLDADPAYNPNLTLAFEDFSLR